MDHRVLVFGLIWYDGIGKEQFMTEGILLALCIFVFAPVTVFTFIIMLSRGKQQTEQLRYKKEIVELELKKHELQLTVLQEENKKYDRVLSQNIELK